LPYDKVGRAGVCHLHRAVCRSLSRSVGDDAAKTQLIGAQGDLRATGCAAVTRRASPPSAANDRKS
jgi:hypothetical protein